MNRLEAVEMWVHRRMLHIQWTDIMISNATVLQRAGVHRELLTIIKVRKVSYLGHVLRGGKYKFLHLIIKGKIEGRRGVGRRQISWLRNIREWTGIGSVKELFRAAQDRDAYSRVIVNVGAT